MKTLLSTAVIVSSFAALSNTLWMLCEAGGGRIREAGLLSLIRFASWQFGYDPVRPLPDLFHSYKDLTLWSEHLPFLMTAIAVNVLLGIGLAVLAVPFVLLPVRLISRSAGRRVEAGALATTVVALLCLAPAVTLPTQWIARFALELAHWGLVALILSALTLAVCGAGFYLFLRGPAATVHVRRLLLVTGCLAGIILAGAGITVAFKPVKPPAVAGAPNILLISIDSLRKDSVSAYGYPRATTPRIDKLAHDGVRFDMAVAPTSWTLPSHVTLLTALPARLHGVRDTNQRFSRDVVTLAEVLSDAGYATAAFVAGSFLSSTHGFSQGFDVYDDYTILERDRGEYGGHLTSPRSVALVRRWLDGREQQGRQRPFFIFLHMWDVHYEYLPPPPYDTMFDPDYQGSITGRAFMRNPRINRDMPARDLQHIRALYDGEIRYTDDHLGQVFDLLQQRGVFDETITVVTSDHGDEFFEHGGKGHGESLFDEVLRVPLVMRYPNRIPAGQVVERQVRLLDVAPTILDLAGVFRPDKFGYCGDSPSACRSLGPWIQGPTDGLPNLIAYGHLKYRDLSVRTETSKMIRHVSNSGQVSRFDLVNDPGEQVNLFGRDEEQIDTLFSGLLDQWWNAAGEERAEAAGIDASQIEVLRSLGYLK